MSPESQQDEIARLIAQLRELNTPGTLMMAALTNPPLAFPKVHVGGEEYELRYSLHSTFFLEQSGQLGSQTITDWISEHFEKKRSVSAMMVMSGAMMGREVTRNGKKKWQPMPITGKEFSTEISTEEWHAVGLAYTEALKKASEAMTSAVNRLAESLKPIPQTTEPEQPVVIN